MIRLLLLARYFTFGAVVLALVLLALFGKRVSYEQSIKSFFADDDPEMADYQKAARSFGDDNFVFVAYDDPALFTAGGMDRVAELAAAVGPGAIAGVQRVESLDAMPLLWVIDEVLLRVVRAPAAVSRFLLDAARKSARGLDAGAGAGALTVGGSVRSASASGDAEALRALRLRVTRHPLFRGTVVDPTGLTTAVVVRLKKTGDHDVMKTVAAIRGRADAFARAHTLGRPAVVGPPVLLADGFTSIEIDGRRLAVVGMVLIGLVTLGAVRSLWWALVPIVVGWLVWLATEAILAGLNLKLALSGGPLVAQIIVLTMPAASHLAIHFRDDRRREVDPWVAARTTLRAVASPITWCAVTGAIGYGALVISDVMPIKQFGSILAVCTLVASLLVMAVSPIAMLPPVRLEMPVRYGSNSWVAARMNRLTARVSRHPGAIVGGVVAVVAPVVLGIGGLRFESNYINAFKPRARVVRDYHAVESRLGGIGLVEMIVPAGKSIDLAAVGRFHAVEGAVKAFRLHGGPAVAHVLSIATVLDPDGRAAALDPAQAERWLAAKLDLIASTPQAELLDGFWNRSTGEARILVRLMEQQPAPDKEAIFARSLAAARATFGGSSSLTGLSYLMTKTTEAVIRTQWSTFAWSAAGIFAMLTVALRSPRMALLAIMPTMLSVGLVLGLMGWLGVKLDMATALVASVALGLSVDDTFHCLLQFRRERASRPFAESLAASYSVTGPGVLLSSLAVAVGFAALRLSEFAPFSNFGTMVGIATAGSTLGNLVLLPACLTLGDRYRRDRRGDGSGPPGAGRLDARRGLVGRFKHIGGGVIDVIRRPFLKPFALTAAVALAAGGGSALAADAPVAADLVIKGGALVDGTGAAGRTADVAVKGDRVVAVGAFEVEPGARVIDAEGLVVAPGFIDLHTHSDDAILKEKTRSNLNYQAQGVTTVVTGNCGGGALDVATYFAALDAKGAGTNVIHLVPLGTVRSAVMGNAERRPTPGEVAKMRGLVERGMRAGAWGVSTGLIYLPGRYAETSEIIELAKPAARRGGIYASHIRDEGAGLLDSIDEAIAVGEGAGLPVHLSHLKATGKANWGLTTRACEKIEAAPRAGKAVSADQYPYTASSTKLAAMVVPHWALQGAADDFGRIADDPARGARLRREIQADLDGRDGGASVRIARYPAKPSRVGLDLVKIAEREGTSPVEVVIDVQRHGGAQAISFGMTEPDVRGVMKHDFVATASDGAAHLPGGGDRPHPRAYGTFPRKIRYALDEGVISLEQAVRAASGLPAEILRLPDRGVVRAGAFADLVVFDPNTFRDAATFDHPTRYAPGVRHLFVNGVAVIDGGRPRKVFPGRALRLNADGPADLVLKLGKVWTGDRGRPWAEAVAARAGEVVAVGSHDEMAAFVGPNTRVVDRADAFGMPGLIDAHGHLADLGAVRDEIDLRGVASPEAVAKLVGARVKAKPGDSWVTGQSWDQSLWPGGAFPTAAVLDAVAPDRPVFLRRVDGHAGWANSEAMRRAKVGKTTAAPADGQILRGKDGAPTGVFVDGAMDLIARAAPAPTKADLERRLLAAQEVVLNAGLTGVHDAGVGPLDAEAFRDLDRAGKLKLRVYGMASLPPADQLAFVSKPPASRGAGARFQLRAVKIFIDGAMGSRGGLLFKDYSDDPGNSGLLLIDPGLLERVTAEALRRGWQVCTHAIGDRGNALVLDAYAAALKAAPGAKDARLRVEHAQVVRREDVARFKALGVIASMQPSHASDDMRWADARLGPGRVDGAYAWRWFLDAGVPVAFGSDFPVEIVNPFYGFYAALTRQDDKGRPAGGWHPDQRLTLEETLRGFTAGAAYAQFAEDRLGVLKVGMRADLTVVDRDLSKSAPLDLLKSRVVLTVIDGEVVAEPGRRPDD